MSRIKRIFPMEITAYKSQMFFGLTTRQVICTAIAIALTVPTVLIGKEHLSSDVIGWFIIAETVPFGIAGWMSYNDMPFEKIALKVFEFTFGKKQRIWQFESREVIICNALRKIHLDELTIERNAELAAEKKKRREK